jgi:hypothetical protein
VVECLPSYREALSSKPSTAKKIKIGTSLGYIMSSRLAWATWGNPVSSENKFKKEQVTVCYISCMNLKCILLNERSRTQKAIHFLRPVI